jgi:hypothetical protein
MWKIATGTSWTPAVLLVLLGCASPAMAQAKWYKAGSSQADFDRDKAQCQKDSAAGVVGHDLFGPIKVDPKSASAAKAFNMCMKGRGYSNAPPVNPRIESRPIELFPSRTK